MTTSTPPAADRRRAAAILLAQLSSTGDDTIEATLQDAASNGRPGLIGALTQITLEILLQTVGEGRAGAQLAEDLAETTDPDRRRALALLLAALNDELEAFTAVIAEAYGTPGGPRLLILALARLALGALIDAIGVASTRATLTARLREARLEEGIA